MAQDLATKLTTETPYFTELLSEVRKGEIKIPQFQRKFVWKDTQALELLDSIKNRYPIGSVLLWKTKDKLHAERNIGNFKLPKTDELSPTNYVLDGQQRITVIYSCLGASESEDGFAAGYDLEKQVFVELKGGNHSRLEVFPLRKMYKTTSLLDYRTGLLTSPNAAELQQRLDELISAFTQYKLPVVTLKDLTIDEVCPIFERINSSGTKLSTYDLMVAATWNRDFDLNESVDTILDALDSKGYGNTDKATVLKSLSAIQIGSIKDKSLRTLRDLDSEAMKQISNKTQEALARAIDVLNTTFRVHSWDFISYEAILIILAFVMSETKHLDAKQSLRLRQWFWRASFGERYKVGGEGFVSNDMQIVRDFILNGVGKSSEFGQIPSAADWGNIAFRSNVSRSRAFILALASRNPKNLTNGLDVDVVYALSSYNRKEYHHFYPKAFLAATHKEAKCNSLVNFVMLTSHSNKEISDSSPSVYVPKIVDSLGLSADGVFESNLLPKPSAFDYERATFEDFCAARGEIISTYIENNLIG